MDSPSRPNATASRMPVLRDDCCRWLFQEFKDERRTEKTRRGVLDDQMNIVLPVLGVAFAALCIWLTVRIANRRERWAKRTAIVFGTIVPFGIYFGAYAIMVVPLELTAFSAGFFTSSIYPVYGIPGCRISPGSHQRICQDLFGPANWIDKRIRPQTWKGHSSKL